MKYALLIGLMVVSSSLYAGRDKIKEGIIPLPSDISLKKVHDSLEKAFHNRGWQLRKIDDKQFEAKLYIRSHMAHVKVLIEETVIRIVYEDSVNLKYKEKRNGKRLIHGNYNKWVNYICEDVKVFMSRDF